MLLSALKKIIACNNGIIITSLNMLYFELAKQGILSQFRKAFKMLIGCNHAAICIIETDLSLNGIFSLGLEGWSFDPHYLTT